MITCSVCKSFVSERTGVEVHIDAPQTNRRLIFTLCALCQDKARDHTLEICIGCNTAEWKKADTVAESGVNYLVKASCLECVAKGMLDEFKWEVDSDDLT